MKYAAACVHVKNEEDIIGEWMAFHRAVGFEHLIIIDNASTDRTCEIIRCFPDQDSITYIFLPTGGQLDFYQRTLHSFGDKFHWMAFIDADEFLHPSGGGDIREVLAVYEAAAAIGVFWQMYGPSSHLVKPEGLVIDNFACRADQSLPANRHIKCIVKPHNVLSPLTAHLFLMNGRCVDENWRDFHYDPPYGWFEDMIPSYKILRINHYHYLSKAQFEKKIMRGYWGGEIHKLNKMREKMEILWIQSNQFDIVDKSAQQYLELMKSYSS